MSDKISEHTNNQEYQYGFTTEIENDNLSVGLNEDTIRKISVKKNEPPFMLSWRLNAYNRWRQMSPPTWPKLKLTKIDYQNIIYYAAPKSLSVKPKSLSEIDPELIATYNKLGVPLKEHEALSGVAVDAIFDSVAVATTFKEKLEKIGIIFCPFSEAIQKYPELIQQYLGTIVSYNDNFFASLNAAVFSDGSFVYIPKGVRCPMELSTYFRINAAKIGQFERTLIIADDNSYVSYLEGCTAPMREEYQLHAAVVELIALDNAEIKYSTVQNWYPGDREGNGGIYNFVTKRGECRGVNAKISWTQIEVGSAITWKYPGTILRGDNSISEFYSVALTNNCQQADTGTKMIHLGKNTKSVVISKGISMAFGQNTYRGLVAVLSGASHAHNYTQCDSLLLGNKCGAYTYPKVTVKNKTASVAHEASLTKVSDEQLFYCRQRNIQADDAIAMIVNGFCHEVFRQLPMEFAVEAHKLIAASLEGVTLNYRYAKD
ncbi:MAG: Fe-S cluster assembly protein SufB [Coxiellaceae bacterium]|nr:Fe-S cluster assembly protein SufB [Coxiellaceae bacterium]